MQTPVLSNETLHSRQLTEILKLLHFDHLHHNRFVVYLCIPAVWIFQCHFLTCWWKYLSRWQYSIQFFKALRYVVCSSLYSVFLDTRTWTLFFCFSVGLCWCYFSQVLVSRLFVKTLLENIWYSWDIFSAFNDNMSCFEQICNWSIFSIPLIVTLGINN